MSRGRYRVPRILSLFVCCSPHLIKSARVCRIAILGCPSTADPHAILRSFPSPLPHPSLPPTFPPGFPQLHTAFRHRDCFAEPRPRGDVLCRPSPRREPHRADTLRGRLLRSRGARLVRDGAHPHRRVPRFRRDLATAPCRLVGCRSYAPAMRCHFRNRTCASLHLGGSVRTEGRDRGWSIGVVTPPYEVHMSMHSVLKPPKLVSLS